MREPSRTYFYGQSYQISKPLLLKFIPNVQILSREYAFTQHYWLYHRHDFTESVTEICLEGRDLSHFLFIN